MNMIINIYRLYYDGFKNMKIGKTLWKLILVKLLLIFIVLNHFVYDKSIKTEYITFEAKSNFVYENLIKEK